MRTLFIFTKNRNKSRRIVFEIIFCFSLFYSLEVIEQLFDIRFRPILDRDDLAEDIFDRFQRLDDNFDKHLPSISNLIAFEQDYKIIQLISANPMKEHVQK